MGQYLADETGTMQISNMVSDSEINGMVKMTFRNGANFPDKFFFLGNGTAQKASGPGDWAGISDARVKDEITPFSDGLEVVTALEPKQFVYNGNANTQAGQKAIGLIAQDVEKIAPYVVVSKMDKLHPTDATESEILMLDTSPFLYVTINAIKQLNARIADLERQLAELQ